jgi:thioredoxin-like negative regulator of GroEL
VYFQRWLIILAVLSSPLLAAPATEWRITRSEHFEVYAQLTDQRARAILTWFEQLRAFFEQQAGTSFGSLAPVRVIVFASDREYQPYRLRSTADAYYVGSGSQDYIVLGADDPVKFGLAAHEYAHLALRAWNVQLPPWLAEGLAEFFATLRITEHATALGGTLPGRVQTLESHAWMPLANLMSLSEESRAREERATANLFYAESWALTEMLLLSPDYAPQFSKFIALLRSGSPGLEAFQRTFAKSGEEITRDLHVWLARRVPQTLQLPEVVAKPVPAQVSDIQPLALRLLLAQLLLAAGEFERAGKLFAALGQDAPESAAVSAALGMIALHNGDSAGASRFWKRAIDQGIPDGRLCYQYAVLADQAGLPPADIRPVLERALQLQPDFDDAHYQLALLEKNDRHYEAALREFQAMRVVSPARAYAYWLALADTFNELGLRDEALSAARHASEHVTTSAERARAAEESYIAQTELAVQFTSDASGLPRLVTTRRLLQQSEWNPFIEPSDDIQSVQGILREIECGRVTTIRVEAAGTLITLAIPDLQHVQMRHAPPEFVCGPQTPTQVTVEYARTPNAATAGIVRGMDF